ncbi:unnamed protein product [Rotaria socialis]|uniref:Uncharacterized protein n=1 Tax=Rotaria socialis TaxID=392032 RepID=A0A820T4M3_9BILA|nr:unnamed protein product [Rotaria socialis]CAF4462977.1 unnamed protein product [Rotaria socialis]
MLAPKLHSLIICPGEYIDSLNQLLTQILGLSKLKYCKIAYESQASQNMFPCYLTKHDDCSPMEYLSFNGRFPFESLNNLLSCRPRLHHLSINSLVKCVREELRDVSPIELKYLKCVSLNIDCIQFDKFEKILKTFFHSVEILNITTCYREERQDYNFHCELDNQIYPQTQENNLTSVKRVKIRSRKINQNWTNYFPNSTQLTIEQFFEALVSSISANLNCMIPLKQLTKLVIESYKCPFEEIVKLLCFTLNFDTLKLHLLCLKENDIELIAKSENFQRVEKTNKIKNFDLRCAYSYKVMQLIVNLFSKLEYLKTRMN